MVSFYLLSGEGCSGPCYVWRVVIGSLELKAYLSPLSGTLVGRFSCNCGSMEGVLWGYIWSFNVLNELFACFGIVFVVALVIVGGHGCHYCI